MRFHLSEEQRAIQDTLRGTIADTLPIERLLAHLDGEDDFDRTSWDALMALGLGGIALPEEMGGSGLGVLDLALAMEALGEGAVVGPILEHCLTTLVVSRSRQAESLLPMLASGSAAATLAFDDGWLPRNWTVENVGGKISGHVRFVAGGMSAQYFLVGTKGGGLHLIERGPSVSVEPVRSSDRSRRLSSVRFAGAPGIELFAPGEAAVSQLFDIGLVLVAADALGGAQHLVDRSVAYAKEREQFDQPIGRFQALKHQIATMALDVEPARALVWYAAHAQDAGLADASRTAAITKAHLADRFVSVARAAVAAHGGIGYTWECGLNIWFRRALFDRAYLGGPAIHRARAAELTDW